MPIVAIVIAVIVVLLLLILIKNSLLERNYEILFPALE